MNSSTEADSRSADQKILRRVPFPFLATSVQLASSHSLSLTSLLILSSHQYLCPEAVSSVVHNRHLSLACCSSSLPHFVVFSASVRSFLQPSVLSSVHTISSAPSSQAFLVFVTFLMIGPHFTPIEINMLPT
jgi:hypothetical protein